MFDDTYDRGYDGGYAMASGEYLADLLAAEEEIDRLTSAIALLEQENELLHEKAWKYDALCD